MASLGYHASHEQFPPSQLLEWVKHADEAGFTDCLASDHFHPWSTTQGESGHVWSWLGAAMNATSMTFGTVNAPGDRYHPAIVAQAAATLREMHPERFWLGVGSGQLLNEGITGNPWPMKAQRNERLRECVDVMQRLWEGKEVTHHGLVTVEEATLYTRAKTPPPLFGAALSEGTARWLGTWADGLITLGTGDLEDDAARVEAFRESAPEKPVILKSQLSYAPTENEAFEGAMEQWRFNCLPGPATQQFRTPEAFEEISELVDEERVRQDVRISADLSQHTEWIQNDLDLGAEKVILHNVNTNQEAFIQDFGENVLPKLS